MGIRMSCYTTAADKHTWKVSLESHQGLRWRTAGILCDVHPAIQTAHHHRIYLSHKVGGDTTVYILIKLLNNKGLLSVTMSQ